MPFGDDDGFLDDDLFGDDDDMDYEDDFEYFEFKNRKEKVSAINDFFGSGKMFGANFKQSEKVIDFDMIETTWNHLLNESSQSELREMAEKMGALVDSKMTKKALIGAIRLMYDKRRKNLYELLSMKELDFLKKAEKSAINLKGMTPIDCLTVTKNDLIHLLSLGLIDVYVAYECEEYVLYVSAIEEIKWSHARL